MSRPQLAIVLLAALVGLGAGTYLGISQLTKASQIGKPAIDTLYATTLPDLSAQPQAISQWKGKTLVVNFWATWCPPCREEIPGLIAVQARNSAKNIQIVGIALDTPEQVTGFAKSLGINYPLLLGGLDAINLTRLLGNASGGLPFTAVISPDGVANRTHLGMLSESELESIIAQLVPVSKQ